MRFVSRDRRVCHGRHDGGRVLPYFFFRAFREGFLRPAIFLFAFEAFRAGLRDFLTVFFLRSGFREAFFFFFGFGAARGASNEIFASSWR